MPTQTEIWNARIARIKDETQNFTVCDDVTRLHITENDAHILAIMSQNCKPQYRADIVRAAAFISAIAGDDKERQRAYTRLKEQQQNSPSNEKA